MQSVTACDHRPLGFLAVAGPSDSNKVFSGRGVGNLIPRDVETDAKPIDDRMITGMRAHCAFSITHCHERLQGQHLFLDDERRSLPRELIRQEGDQVRERHIDRLTFLFEPYRSRHGSVPGLPLGKASGYAEIKAIDQPGDAIHIESSVRDFEG